MPDFLTQALWALEELVRAYRLVTRAPIADFTYQALYPLVVSIETDLDGQLLTGPTGWSLNSSGGSWIVTSLHDLDVSEPVQMEFLERAATRLSKGDQFVLYSDRLWRAERHLHIDGQHDLAVLQAAIAIEGLLVSTWIATQWERGLDSVATIRTVSELAGEKTHEKNLGMAFIGTSRTLGSS